MKRRLLQKTCFKLTLASMTFVSITGSVFAGVPSLDGIDQAELDNVSEEFSANFTHTTVSPAKSLGRVWGFELGLVAGITKTPILEGLVKEVTPATTVDKIPHGGLMGMLTVPYGITLEATLIPEKTVSDVTVKNTSFAAKWTATELFPVSPWIDAALRLHYSGSELSYAQEINNSSGFDADAKIGFESKVWGMNATVSSDVLIFEPFVGVGFLKSSTDVAINASGSATIFSFSSSQSATSKASSAHLFAGLQLDLLFLHVSGEVSRAFGTTSYTGKFSFFF